MLLLYSTSLVLVVCCVYPLLTLVLLVYRASTVLVTWPDMEYKQYVSGFLASVIFIEDVSEVELFILTTFNSNTKINTIQKDCSVAFVLGIRRTEI